MSLKQSCRKGSWLSDKVSLWLFSLVWLQRGFFGCTAKIVSNTQVLLILVLQWWIYFYNLRCTLEYVFDQNSSLGSMEEAFFLPAEIIIKIMDKHQQPLQIFHLFASISFAFLSSPFTNVKKGIFAAYNEAYNHVSWECFPDHYCSYLYLVL